MPESPGLNGEAVKPGSPIFPLILRYLIPVPKDKYGIAYYRASEAEVARGHFNKEPLRTVGTDTTPEQYELLRARRLFSNYNLRDRIRPRDWHSYKLTPARVHAVNHAIISRADMQLYAAYSSQGIQKL